MTSFFEDLKNPKKPAGPVELGDLRAEVDRLTKALSSGWTTSIFAPQKRDGLFELLTERIYEHACRVANIRVPKAVLPQLLAIILDTLEAEPLLRWRGEGGLGLDYKALLHERAQLLKVRSLLHAPDVPLDLLNETVGGVLGLILKDLPMGAEEGIAFETKVIDVKVDLPATIDGIVGWLLGQRSDLEKHGILPRWSEQITQNVLQVAGLTEKATQREFDQRYKKAAEQRSATSQELLDTYLGGMPFVRAFELPWAFHL